jgi:serine phosphatase RsbU (regulator of sigma subunit)
MSLDTVWTQLFFRSRSPTFYVPGALPGANMKRPDQVLGTLNDAYPSNQHGDKFFTIWYGVYQRSNKTLTWSGGGHHPSILLVPQEPDPVLLPSTGPVMGRFAEWNTPLNRVALRSALACGFQ